MGRRRRNDGIDLEALAPLIAFLVLFCGAAIVVFLKTLLTVLAVLAAVALVGFLLYQLTRRLIERQLNINGWLPSIDWTFPSIPTAGEIWPKLVYPEFSTAKPVPAPCIQGTSGAWKDVLNMVQAFPSLKSAIGPRDLEQRIVQFEARRKEILDRALEAATATAKDQGAAFEGQLQHLMSVEEKWVSRVQPDLRKVETWIESLQEGGFIDRLRARRLEHALSPLQTRFTTSRQELHTLVTSREQALRRFLDPVQRESFLTDALQRDLARMREIIASPEFAGAAAEMAVIEELSSLRDGAMVFNDVKLESDRFVRFEGKPVMSAQIDTLVITRAGVFIVEVKNWSRKFAQSGQGFDPYEQVGRANRLVYSRLSDAGLSVKVRSIIATNGALPEKKGEYVKVCAVGRISGYIEYFPSADVDITQVQRTLGL